ncbi:hypothetical protein RYA05_00835 [Pseudomonas syringae pv. actinidiae]|nr:hypothetical protein [Pseudomonas syringae pv. actinidiae]
MNSASAIGDLVNYYNTVHTQNLDWSLIQQKVIELRNNLDPADKLSAQEDYVLRYLSVVYEYYREQSEINVDFIEEGIDLGHLNIISYAASLLSFGVYGFQNHREKILSGCSEILKLYRATIKHEIFDTLCSDGDRGGYLGGNDIIFQHDFTAFDIGALDRRPSPFSFGNQEISEQVFSISEWKSIARFLELHAEALKEQAGTGKPVTFSHCLSIGNYKFYVVKYPDVAHVTIQLTGAHIFKKSISDEDKLIEFELLIDELKDFISVLESSASHTFSDPSLFLSDYSPQITHL